MEITFKNLDKEYIKGRREVIGDIQPKFWYYGRQSRSSNVLVKRQSGQAIFKNQPRSPMFNHIGEYFGYLLAEKAGVRACPVDLVTLHDTKNKYSPTIRLYTACASHSVKKPGTTLMDGELIVNSLLDGKDSTYNKYVENLLSQSSYGPIFSSSSEDNIDLIIAGIVRETRNVEKQIGIRTRGQVEEDVEQNIQDIIDVAVFDCIFGNHDRHSGNWAMEIDPETGLASIYSAYDNEAVLGLRKPLAEIEDIMKSSSSVDNRMDEVLFSRMGYTKRPSKANYKEMLDHLVETYPKYAIPSIFKITSNVDEKFLEELYRGMVGISKRGEDYKELTNLDELPEVYRDFGLKAFRNRREYALSLIRNRTKIGEKNER